MGAGLLCLFGAPWVVRGMAAWDAAIARRLLAPSHVDRLARRVEMLSENQLRLIDAADAERHRIERDLHDETQQRLTVMMEMSASPRGLTQPLTVVMVTHDPVAASYADSVVFLTDGQVVDTLHRPTAGRIAAHMTALERR
ncbi:histidine kinase [Nonomuraea candida]|uniref:histidine kinase n=1 Tax=Nonomuraea candida TaxID=359159 RepID=UPI0005BC1FE0|nr:histidine kinase [Nonomuraea candida]